MNTEVINVTGVESARIRIGATSGEFQIEAAVNVASNTVQSVENGIVRKEGLDVASFHCYGTENFGVNCTGASDRNTRREINEVVEDFTEAAMQKVYIIGLSAE